VCFTEYLQATFNFGLSVIVLRCLNNN